MTGILRDLRFAVRLLLKSPSFTLIVVLTLAIGIGANTAIFSVINAVLLRSLPYRDPHQLVMLWESNPQIGEDQLQVVGTDYLDWREQSKVFDEIGFMWNFSHNSRKFNLIADNETEFLHGRYVSASFFDVLGVNPLLGRTFTEEEDRQQGNRVVILSHGLWMRRFNGSRDVIGKDITLDNYDNRRVYTVVGIMPPRFAFPGECDLWLPAGWMQFSLEWYRPKRRGAHFQVIGRLKPDVTVESAQTQLNTLQARIVEENPNAPIGTEIVVVPLLDQLIGDLRSSLFLVWGAVVCVLLITCANVDNLLLARAATREKEIAIRMALGTSRARIIRQLLTESILLAILGGIVGIGLAYAGGEMLMALSPTQTTHVKDVKMDRSQETAIDYRVLAFTVLTCLVTGVVFGLAPAIHSSNPNLEQSLREGGRGSSGGRKRQRIRSALVVSQVALAFTLLIAAVLMIRSFARLLQVDPGFSPENLVAGTMDWVSNTYASNEKRIAVTNEILGKLQNLPGITSVCGVGELPLQGAGWTEPLVFEGSAAVPDSELLTCDVQVVTPGYFSTMRSRILKGRDFTSLDTNESPRVGIINETMAKRFWPNSDPVGQRLAFRVPRDWIEIVAVVGDIKQAGLAQPVRPMIHLSYAQSPAPIINFVVRTKADPAAVEDAMRREVLQLTKDQPLAKTQIMEDVLMDSVSQLRFRAVLLGLFALVALILATIGIYGVMSYSVTQRTREIGIRMALGVPPADVVKMILLNGMKLAVIGASLGALAAVATARVIQSQLYGIVSSDPLTYVAVAVVLLLAAFVACFVPAYRATSIDPMIAL